MKLNLIFILLDVMIVFVYPLLFMAHKLRKIFRFKR